MFSKKISVAVAATALVAGSLLTAVPANAAPIGAVRPAAAIASCVSVNIQVWNDLFDSWSRGTATSGCNHSVSGRWRYSNKIAVGNYTTSYGPCVTLPTMFSRNVTADKAISILGQNGVAVSAFVTC